MSLIAKCRDEEELRCFLTETPAIELKDVLEEKDSFGRTALSFAIQRKHNSCAKLLFQAEANICNPDLEGRAALHWCCGTNQVDILGIMLEKLNSASELCIRDNQGRTPLHWACGIKCEPKPKTHCLQQILEHIHNLHGSSSDESCIACGSALLCRDEAGWNPFLLAAQVGSECIITTLLSHVQCINALLEQERHSDSNCDSYNKLTSQGSCDYWGHTVLHIAAASNQANVLGIFLDHICFKPMIDFANIDGLTALHVACASGHLDCVKCLLQNGANPIIESNFGRNSFEMALCCRSKSCAMAIAHSSPMSLENTKLRLKMGSDYCHLSADTHEICLSRLDLIQKRLEIENSSEESRENCIFSESSDDSESECSPTTTNKKSVTQPIPPILPRTPEGFTNSIREQAMISAQGDPISWNQLTPPRVYAKYSRMSPRVSRILDARQKWTGPQLIRPSCELKRYSDQELLQLLQSRDPVEECSWPIKIINLISPCNPAVHYSLLWRQKHVSTLPEIKRRKIDEDSTKFPNESKVDVGDIYGVVAARNITKGEIVAEYTGWLCTIHEMRKRHNELSERHFGSSIENEDFWREAYCHEVHWTESTDLIELGVEDDEIVVDASECSSEACFINDFRFNPWSYLQPPHRLRNVHNVEVWINGIPRLLVEATADIHEGEELLTDYGDVYWNEFCRLMVYEF